MDNIELFLMFFYICGLVYCIYSNYRLRKKNSLVDKLLQQATDYTGEVRLSSWKIEQEIENILTKRFNLDVTRLVDRAADQITDDIRDKIITEKIEECARNMAKKYTQEHFENEIKNKMSEALGEQISNTLLQQINYNR